MASVPTAAAYCGIEPPEGIPCCGGIQVWGYCIEPACGGKLQPPCPMATVEPAVTLDEGVPVWPAPIAVECDACAVAAWPTLP